MSNEFKNLARFSFGGVEFPVDGYSLRGSGRQHVHIYAHVHGGDPEKLGRNLYEAECSACFYKNAPQTAADLWPSRLALLREMFEAQITDWLVIPSVGRFKAFATAWDQEFTARILNGEKAKFRFMEDQAEAFTIEGIVNVQTKSVQAAAEALAVTLEQALADQAGSPRDKDLLDSIQETANSIFAVRDQIELGGRLFAERVAMLAALCDEAVNTVDFFDDPKNWFALEATKDLWAASFQLHVDLSGGVSRDRALADAGGASGGRPHSGAGVAVKFAWYTVQDASMSISEIATAIYGSTARAMELLQLNSVEDAFVIPRGTQIRYVVDETSLAA